MTRPRRLPHLRLPRAGLLRPLAAVVVGAAVSGGGMAAWAAPAGADPAGAGLAGYNAAVQAIGAQFGFGLPGALPVSGNILEDDVPIARSTASSGPVVSALGAAWYPGDLAANVGTLIETFGATSAVPNDPALARAQYPTSPGTGSDATFGPSPPASGGATPAAASATAHAGPEGSTVTATISRLGATPAPGGAAAPVTGPLGAVLGGLAPAGPGDLVVVASARTTDSVAIGASTISGTAGAELKGITIAGVVDIAGLTSSAGSVSDGTTGTPTASLHLGQVTVAGVPAYIDRDGIHLAALGSGAAGASTQQASTILNGALAADGISVRLADPSTTVKGAEAVADAGGLVISSSRQFYVPVVPGEPSIPIPVLGNQGLPAGTTTFTTSIVLGSAVTDVSATTAPAFTDGAAASTDAGTSVPVAPPSDTGAVGGDTGSVPTGGTGGDTFATVAPTGPGSSAVAAAAATVPAAPGILSGLARLPGLGLSTPVGWVILSLLACLLFTYPMLMIARWQFLGRRR